MHKEIESKIIYSVISHYITRGVWKLNSPRIIKSVLRGKYGIDREKTRIVLRALGKEKTQENKFYGLTQLNPRVKERTKPLVTLIEHYTLRCQFESIAVQKAALNRTEEDLKEMNRLLSQRGQYNSSLDLAEFVEKDLAFHSAVMNASGDADLIKLHSLFSGVITTHTKTVLNLRELPEPGLYSHHDIYLAIEAGDGDMAVKSVRVMWSNLIYFLTTKLYLTDQREAKNEY